MADSTNFQLYDGQRNVQFKYTNYSDGTGQSGAVLLNVSTLNPNPGTHIKIRRIKYSIQGMSVRLQWAATTPVDIAILSQGQDILDWSNTYAGGYPDNGGTGATGNILITTVGALAGSSCTLELECIKGV